MNNLTFEYAFKPSPQATVREVCDKMASLNESTLHADVWYDGDYKILRVEKSWVDFNPRKPGVSSVEKRLYP